MKKIFLLAILFSFKVIAQKDGYWDKERATSKEVTLSAGKRTLLKSEDLPVGTTEFIYRITVLDENQKLSSSLVSVLKAIPDPSGISQGAAGAIHLTSTIAGSDKCTYALFSSADAANLFLKEAKLDGACLTDKEKVNKVARLVSTSSTCLTNIPYLWFGIESQNWVMNQKIVLEVVPWVDYNASRGWTNETKNEIVELAKKSEGANFLSNKNTFLATFLELVTTKYKYSEFKQMIPIERNKMVETISDESIVKSGNTINFLKEYNLHLRRLSLTKTEDAIKLLHQIIEERKLGKENECDLLGSLYLRTKQYQKAEDWILKAINLNKNEIKFQLHLAHVYLVTDRYTEAKEIHKKYKDQNIGVSTSWINATKQDFENMEKEGLPSNDFKKILRLLD